MKTPTSSLALFLSLNLLFFSLVTACDDHTSPPPSPKPKPTPKPSPTPPNSYYPSPPKSSPSPPLPYPSPPTAQTCPIDALKLGVCANVLGGLLGVKVGIITPPKEECCTIINGLVDLEAAVCLCTAIKANVLGIRLNIPISLSLLLNVCDKRIPPGYQCA